MLRLVLVFLSAMLVGVWLLGYWKSDDPAPAITPASSAASAPQAIGPTSAAHSPSIASIPRGGRGGSPPTTDDTTKEAASSTFEDLNSRHLGALSKHEKARLLVHILDNIEDARNRSLLAQDKLGKATSDREILVATKELFGAIREEALEALLHDAAARDAYWTTNPEGLVTTFEVPEGYEGKTYMNTFHIETRPVDVTVLASTGQNEALESLRKERQEALHSLRQREAEEFNMLPIEERENRITASKEARAKLHTLNASGDRGNKTTKEELRSKILPSYLRPTSNWFVEARPVH